MLRNLLRAADMLPVLAVLDYVPMGYAVGLAVMALDPKFRRIGDLIAGTVVVVEDYGRIGDELVLDPPASVEELASLPARPPLSQRELDAIELLLRRRKALSLARAEELAELLAPTIAERIAARYEDPVRFLALVHARARGTEQAGARAQKDAGVRRQGGTLSQDEFVAQRRESWKTLENLLMHGRNLSGRSPAEISQTASLYRSVCADLMRARAQHDGALVRYLDGLAGRAHNLLYGARTFRLAGLWELVAHEFPQTLRKRWQFFALANALFYLPLLLGLYGAISSPDFAQTILPPQQLLGAEQMYENAIEGRPLAEDTTMAGFYVLNNVGIAFRCFATGALLGIGSLFFSIYNGLVIGTTLGWVTAAGYGQNIFTFICGHGPFELTAIVISAGAGLQLGWALIATGGRTRLGSVRSQARELGALIVGAGAMLVIAAFVEGYWSPSGAAPQVKWVVSAVNCALVTAWLGLGGRGLLARARRRGARQ